MPLEEEERARDHPQVGVSEADRARDSLGVHKEVAMPQPFVEEEQGRLEQIQICSRESA
jgi:hypothetical protein